MISYTCFDVFGAFCNTTPVSELGLNTLSTVFQLSQLTGADTPSVVVVVVVVVVGGGVRLPPNLWLEGQFHA